MSDERKCTQCGRVVPWRVCITDGEALGCAGWKLPRDVPILSATSETLAGVLEDALGVNDHNMRRDRPYDGQAHTDKGLRGSTEIKGITFRDLRDCFIRAVLLSTGGSSYPSEDSDLRARMGVLYAEASKGEEAVLCENDLFGWDLDKLDPIAISQNLSCEVERIMGIYPNIPKS